MSHPTSRPPAFICGKLAISLPARQNAPCLTTRPVRYIRMGRRSAKIQGRKDKQTAKRTKVFARIGKIITMAAKAGGPDIITNRALADAIEMAKAASFPKDTMEKAIQRATSDDQADFKQSSFEAYGPGGAAVFIDVLTDNPNRAAADIRKAVSRNNMKIATPGSVAFNFDRMAIIQVLAESVEDADELLLCAIDAGAEECDLDENDESIYQIIAPAASLNRTRTALAEGGYEIDMAQLEMIPKTCIDVSEHDMEKNQNAIEIIEALEDVDGVYVNAKLA